MRRKDIIILGAIIGLCSCTAEDNNTDHVIYHSSDNFPMTYDRGIMLNTRISRESIIPIKEDSLSTTIEQQNTESQ